MAVSQTPWVGTGAGKLYLQSGQFTTTLKTSVDISGVDTVVSGIDYDGTNTLWSGAQANKLYLQSGQFTTTLKSSEDISSVDTGCSGIAWDGTNTPWSAVVSNKLYLTSGQFTSTIKTSQAVGGVDEADDIDFDGTNSPWCGTIANKLYLQSGQFTSTLKTSEDVTAIIQANMQGISFDGTNTPHCSFFEDKLYLQSGQFTSTLKSSLSVGSVDNTPRGIRDDTFEPAPAAIFGSGSVTGNATVSGETTGTFHSDGSVVGNATMAGAASGLQHAGGALSATATVSGDATFRVRVQGSAALNGTATVTGDTVILTLASGTVTGNATVIGLTIDRFGAGSAQATATITGYAEQYTQAVNPPLGSFDPGNSANFTLTVAGTPVDLAAPFFNPTDLSISYDGKELSFSEIGTPGFGSPTFNPEDAVTLDVDLGNGAFRWFTGELRVRETVGQNNNEGFNYTAFGFQKLADEVTLLNTNGRPSIEFTVGTTVTSVRDDGTNVVTIFSKSISQAMQEMFEINAANLGAAGIPATIGAPGLEQFAGNIPETTRFQNVGFASAVTQLAKLETGVKVFFNDQQLAWNFPNLLKAPTAIVEINSVNLMEAVFDVSTEDRFTAVHLFAEVDDLVDEAIAAKSDLAQGTLQRTEVVLTPKWLPELQADWTISLAHQGNLGTLEDENFWVYRRWSLPSSVTPELPGTPIKLWQKFNFWGETKWKRTHGRVNFRRREFTSRFPLIHRGNPHVPGDVIGPLEVKMGYFPGGHLGSSFTWVGSINSSGTPSFISSLLDLSSNEFATQIRVPETSYEGSAFDVFGVDRVLTRVVNKTEVTSANANAMLRMYKDVVIAGDLPIEGDPVETLLNLNRKVVVQHATLTTAIESFPALLTGYSYRFGKRGESTLSLTTDVAGLIPGTA